METHTQIEIFVEPTERETVVGLFGLRNDEEGLGTGRTTRIYLEF